MRFLPTITTTYGSDWKTKIQNTSLEEVAVFVTVLDKEQRNDFYRLLSSSKIKNIPFVHIRGDMEVEELDFFRKNYQTKVFNLHHNSKYPLYHDYGDYKKDIFIENTHDDLEESFITGYGGVCLDFAHLENDRLTNKERYHHLINLLDKYKIGCNHISAVNTKRERFQAEKGVCYDHHYLEDFSELDYLKEYPRKYFTDYCALELENSLEEQLRAIEYLKKLLRS